MNVSMLLYSEVSKISIESYESKIITFINSKISRTYPLKISNYKDAHFLFHIGHVRIAGMLDTEDLIKICEDSKCKAPDGVGLVDEGRELALIWIEIEFVGRGI